MSISFSSEMAEVRLSMIESSLQDEEESNEITFIEQYVQDVVDFSSQYGSDISISYTAYNITGKPSKFPDYGDFPQAFVMVSKQLVIRLFFRLTLY